MVSKMYSAYVEAVTRAQRGQHRSDHMLAVRVRPDDLSVWTMVASTARRAIPCSSYGHSVGSCGLLRVQTLT